MGTLYVVATPIGNLEDISARALKTLRDVSVIAAEDTRHSGKLLAHYEIDTSMVSYHAFNSRSRRDELLASLSQGDVALITDAGTPAISDPGVELVDAAHDAGYPVVAVPGATALAAAVSVSGLISGPFTFLGFLPRKGSERRSIVGRASTVGFGVVLFESPQRLQETLRELAGPFEGRRFAVARELTKRFEETRRGRFRTGDELKEYAAFRGEIVVVIEAGEVRSGDDTDGVLDALLRSGMKPSLAAREAAQLTGMARSALYQRAMELSAKQGTRTDNQPD